MSIEIARYQFHAWTRKGISSGIIDTDDLGTNTSTGEERATIELPVSLNNETLEKSFALVGPGDIIGINHDMIIRTEPLHYITDFEPNYLAFVEFYDEDFATRYTPAKPVGKKLRPWLLLLVLKEGEFTPGKRKKPLPTINISNKDVFPPEDESWLWLHVHSNSDIPDDELNDYEVFLQSLGTTMNADPDQYYSRLLCPRKLEPNTAYYGFLVPAFETGRLAGLNQSTEHVNAQTASWDSIIGAKGEMPVYFEWYFRTGINADFESLVKLLEPRQMDPKLGIRPMDASKPGFIRVDSPDGLSSTQPGVLGLEGALKAPSTVSTVFPDPDEPNLFQPQLQNIVNLQFNIIGTDTSGDPIISVPLYGGKHAKKLPEQIVKLDVTLDNWVNDLNRDPRTRVAAGLGTTVVQIGQENYMRRAWQQVETIVQANKNIRLTAFYMKVALQYSVKTFNRVNPDHLVAMSKPLLKRIMGSPTTLYQQIKESPLPIAVLSPAFRRVTRKSTKLMKNVSIGKSFNYSELVSGLNEGKITAAPPKVIATGMVTTQSMADGIRKKAVIPDWLSMLLKNRNLIMIVVVVLAFMAILSGAYLLVGALIASAAAGYWYTGRLANEQQEVLTEAAALTDPAVELETLERVPQRPQFTLRMENEPVAPPATLTASDTDSVEAMNFRKALTEMNKRLAVIKPEIPLVKVQIANMQAKVKEGIHPHKTFTNRLNGLVKFPGYITIKEPEQVLPVMAYPDFEDPMYKGLTAISSELLLPNLKLVPPNTISLLKVNQKFIESYMVGLNHEMGRELLWREYPTDERGSYFRQFWDVNGVIRPADGRTDAERREEFKDINPIHTWGSASLLGSHNKREPDAGEEQLVLLIRGDLLKRYPNTLIFAQKAIAKPGEDFDPGINTELDEENFLKHVKFPLYKAEINPDIKFFGFDLTIEQAKGTSGSVGFPDDDLGWFFIIQEVPGEPRFGMDIQPTETPTSWADLSWVNILPEGPSPEDPSTSITIIKKANPPNIAPTDVATWGTDSAAMAYILFQKPSMVAVHAKDMLEKLTN